jgi:uncharacterized membrane protein YjfL (UPF0719 family)
LVLLVTLAAVAAIPVATNTGTKLRAALLRTGLPIQPRVEHHASLGRTLIWFGLPLLLVAIVLWYLGRRSAKSQPVDQRLNIAVIVIAVVVAVATGIQVARVGHSGAQTIWTGVGTPPTTSSG